MWSSVVVSRYGVGGGGGGRPARGGGPAEEVDWRGVVEIDVKYLYNFKIYFNNS